MHAAHSDSGSWRGRSGPSRANGIIVPRGVASACQANPGPTMQTNRTIIGVDTAKWVLSKWVFHLYWVEVDTGEDMNVPLSRVKFLRHFANRVPCLVVIDAIEANTGPGNCRDSVTRSGFCRSKVVRPFVRGSKNDTHDARAVWTAVQQPGVRMVAAVKTEEQQAILALHRMRQQLVKFRTAQINGLRGLLTEYGEVMPKGRGGGSSATSSVPWGGCRSGYRRWPWTACAINGLACCAQIRKS